VLLEPVRRGGGASREQSRACNHSPSNAKVFGSFENWDAGVALPRSRSSSRIALAIIARRASAPKRRQRRPVNAEVCEEARHRPAPTSPLLSAGAVTLSGWGGLHTFFLSFQREVNTYTCTCRISSHERSISYLSAKMECD